MKIITTIFRKQFNTASKTIGLTSKNIILRVLIYVTTGWEEKCSIQLKNTPKCVFNDEKKNHRFKTCFVQENGSPVNNNEKIISFTYRFYRM